MSYRLEPDETIPDGIKRIVREQADKALYSLTESDEPLDERIHDARKRFKKIRAVMRLVRDEIGDEVYQRENAAYRDMGRQLADLRESAVALETPEAIIEHYELEPDAFGGIRETLKMSYDLALDRVTNNDVIKQVVATLKEAQGRIDDLPIEHNDFSALHDGLRRVYERGYKRIDDAYDDPTPENFHEWRKRVKYLWYHMRILEMLWPDVMDEFGDAAHDLADYLGDAHDLADLADHVNDAPLMDDEATQHLIELATGWRRELEAQAEPLGRRIYAEDPDAFIERISAYWAALQAEPR